VTPAFPVIHSELLPALRYKVLAEDQPQYISLPALVSEFHQGRLTTRWSLTWRERWKLLRTGTLFIQVLTFGEPLMPLKPMVDEPTAEQCL
jgi:hypothetical protein